MLTAIATLRSPFADKFGVPRQSGLAHEIEARVVFDRTLVDEAALRGVEACSHLWLIFGFHLVAAADFRSTVRPPRLGGNQRMGVYATRSPFRHNRLGLSAVELVAVEGLTLRVRGADIVDGTPIYDVKPYVPYADALPLAQCAWAPSAPAPIEVRVAPELDAQLGPDERRRAIIRQASDCLRWDPRPAYTSSKPTPPGRAHWLRLDNFDIGFCIDAQGRCVIVELRELPAAQA